MATQEFVMPRLGKPGDLCTACSTPLATDQRYCLNCGTSRAQARVPYAAVLGFDDPSEPTKPAAPASAPQAIASAEQPNTTTLTVPRWWQAGLAGAALALMVAGALIGSAVSSPEISVPQAKAPVVNIGGAAAAPTAAAAPLAAAAFTSDWSGADGWTVQLQVLDKATSDAAAVAAAKTAATGNGATDVGALDTDAFGSLTAGQYLVYSGRYDTKKDAEAALEGLTAKFPDAKVVKVSTDANDSASTDTSDAPAASKNTLSNLQSKSGDDFVKESKKLPDELATQGAAPEADNKAPGGEDAGDAEVIE